MAFRLRVVPEKTNIDFFRAQWLTFGGSMALTVLSILVWIFMGLNFGIDFRGGTTIRTEATRSVDVGAYRQALSGLDLGDVAITEVFDPTFAADQFVAQIRIAPLDGEEAVTPEVLSQVEQRLKAVDPSLTFASVESVGPKVSGELIWKAITAMVAASVCILIYIWLRFEWQYAVGSVVALLHDIFIVIGIFALFQIKFDLTIIAALLTILGYSINDTVVVFDRLRENLLKYKSMPLKDVMNLSVNETLSRTIMTSGTTLMALGAMLIFGGDVIRGFTLAIFIGVVLGTYSSVFVAKNLVLFIGLDRGDKPKKAGKNEFADVDA
ncbi:protein translocase subunit SecF [Rhodobacter calidifons]|uniref:Protein-export membrane protein SecF n=1 Tax=Rhodobacter calidifons TaxID=2715277 RepID=A0ABX0GA58_9RHOB|nr:protein translocase subunit SecF [Rhodobacter calidifons]NHB78175.1 protein translocase subunit SecF [Rhodobacter calidifons]